MDPQTLDILVKTVLGEARGEGVNGMAAVAQVIRNRANSGRFSSDPAQVALEPKQFSTWNTGEGGNNPQQFKPGTKPYNEAARVIEAVFGGEVPDTTGGALFYHSKGVSPSWSGSVNKHGTEKIGNHVFYPSYPIPPGEIPSVASLIDTTPPPAPLPITPSIDMRLMRGVMGNAAPSIPLPAMGTPKVADLYRGIYPQGDLTTAGAIGKSVASAAAATDTTLADALGRRVAAPKLPGRTDYAAQERAPVSRALPALPQAPSASDRVRQARATPASVSTIASIPTSPIGQPPATRTVQSLPVPAAQPRPDLVRVAGFAGPANVPFPSGVDKGAISPAAASVSASDRTRAARAQPFQDRLPPTPAIPGPDDLGTAKFTDTTAKIRTGQVDQYGAPVFAPAPTTGQLPPIRTAVAPTPLPSINRPAVASQLSVTPPRALPTQMSSYAAPGIQVGATTAPTPMPRLQRGGVFGRPQILGHDIPLPGIFGMIQGATMAMNNASGPFNNGADNALYNGLRGGDFNTPGAATKQSGGYLYAPNDKGGYINVGRVDPSMSAADKYSQLNAGNSGPMNTADRMKAAASDNDGGSKPRKSIW